MIPTFLGKADLNGQLICISVALVNPTVTSVYEFSLISFLLTLKRSSPL